MLKRNTFEFQGDVIEAIIRKHLEDTFGLSKKAQLSMVFVGDAIGRVKIVVESSERVDDAEHN